MENKCNKTPNNSCNKNPTNSKYMDHVYCHSNQQTKSTYNINNNNVTTAGSGVGSGGAATSPNADVLALLKENKQLKSMLILHLDLIQEQSDQLMAKEKTLITCNEEVDTLRGHITALQNQVKDLQKQLQRQIKRSGEISTLPPPPLAKIQCQPVAPIATTLLPLPAANGEAVVASKNIIGECNGKLISKIVLQRVNLPSLGRHSNQSPLSQTSDTENEDEAEEEYDEEDEEEDAEGEDIEDEEENDDEGHLQENLEQEDETGRDLDELGNAAHQSEESMDEKSNSQTVIIDDLYDTGNTTEDSNEVLAVQSKRLRLRQAAKQSLALPRGAKPSVSPASTTTNDGQTAFKAVTSSTSSSSTTTTAPHVSKQPPTPSRGKQMTMMRWHATEYNTDESVSCDSTADNERRSTSATSSSPLKHSTNVAEKKRSYENLSHHPHNRAKIRRCTYISTPRLYSTREWEDEAFNCDNDNEFLKAEVKLAQADNPKLEIPKWTEHDLTPSYCIEGTEDLSDEIFLKRHAKLEVDEKRRKKWDVQQIREQRRIERLKRRHCKDELQPTQDTPSLQTFYPTTDNLQTICFVHDIPVQAFGEMIPRLSAIGGVGGEHRNFLLPWLDKEQLQMLNENNKQPTVAIVNTLEATTSALTQQMFNSTFVLLKKRRRQQSSSNFGPVHNLTSRQRNLAAKYNNTTTSSATSFTTTITTTSSTNTSSLTFTTSAQTFLNVVSSSYTSTFTATPVTTATATASALVGSSSSMNIST